MIFRVKGRKYSMRGSMRESPGGGPEKWVVIKREESIRWRGVLGGGSVRWGEC